MDNRFARDLDLGFTASIAALDRIRSSYQTPEKSSIFKVNLSELDGRICPFLWDLGISIFHSEVFYTSPGRFTTVHVDGPDLDDHCKINWVYGAPGSRMVWYEEAPGSSGPRSMRTAIGSSYLAYDADTCNPIFHAEIGQPSLVNAGFPHNVHNDTNEQRWCVSLVLKYANTERHFVPWDHAVEIFAPFLKSG